MIDLNCDLHPSSGGLGPWAGKTALAAHLIAACPPQVDPVAYFLNRRESDADSTHFTSAVNAQLAWLLGEDPPSGEGRYEFLSLWRRAVEQAEQQGRQLLLVVDGLDEDLGPASPPRLASVAALLPTLASNHARVLVTSRRHPTLPLDVDNDHPLRRIGRTELTSSEPAQDIRKKAEQELGRLLADPDTDDVAYDCLGLLTAARGSLTAADLTALLGHLRGQTSRHQQRRVDHVLKTVIGRVVEAFGFAPPFRYAIAHQELLECSKKAFNRQDQPTNYEQYVHAWADQLSGDRWPASTPTYLLDTYPTLLTDQSSDRSARDRLVALMHDPSFLARQIDVVGISAAMAHVGASVNVLPAGHHRQALNELYDALSVNQAAFRAGMDSLGLIANGLMAENAAPAIADTARHLLASRGQPQVQLTQILRVPRPPRRRQLGGFLGTVFGCAIDDQGDHVATAGEDGAVRLWDRRAERELRAVRAGDIARSCAISGDGGLLVGGYSDGSIAVWLDADEPVLMHRAGDAVMGVAVSVNDVVVGASLRPPELG